MKIRTRQFGSVYLESSSDGSWTYIVDAQGLLWSEVCEDIDVRFIPAEFRDDVCKANDWALEQNRF